MEPLLALAIQINKMWFALPLILATSLVYNATRHELMRPILYYAVRWVFTILILMLLVFGLLWVLSERVNG